VSDPRDPGWRFFGTTGAGTPPLVDLRRIFTFFVGGVVALFAVFSSLIDPDDRWRADLEPDWALWILYAVSAAALLGAGRARSRPLSAAASRALLDSYRGRFITGMAFGESPALLGVIIAFFTNRLWPALIGMVVSLVGFAMMAPTARNIDRDEERLRAAGSPVSLWDALTRPPDASPPRTP
jgi:F0F1-type ATP synthase membrane subunit c/vacuolar-type H+-ATPase subunit K